MSCMLIWTSSRSLSWLVACFNLYSGASFISLGDDLVCLTADVGSHIHALLSIERPVIIDTHTFADGYRCASLVLLY